MLIKELNGFEILSEPLQTYKKLLLSRVWSTLYQLAT